MAPAPVLVALTESERDRVGPHPSYIEIAKPYIFQSTIRDCLAVAGVSEAKDDSFRLQGVAWIDSVRKALQLPVKTYDTACVYYHKFRLRHPDSTGYNDAAAAALFTACKIEDTLKKSKEILCAAHNLKVSPAEQLAPDDAGFEAPSKIIIGLERLMLEASGFDFRNRYPQDLVIKLVKLYQGDKMTLGRTAYNITLDLYRTLAPLKQTTTTMALACVELAGRILGQHVIEIETLAIDKRFCTSREEVMETLLDLLELYSQHKNSTLVGPQYTLQTFVDVRLPLNKEVKRNKFPRYTMNAKRDMEELENGKGATNGTKASKRATTPITSHQDEMMKDVSSPSINGASKPGLKEGTVRFMLDPQRAAEEKRTVAEYFKVEEREIMVEEKRRLEIPEREKRRP